jgi:hypothetical protein
LNGIDESDSVMHMNSMSRDELQAVIAAVRAKESRRRPVCEF